MTTLRPNRRQMLIAGALGACGLSLPQLLAAEATAKPRRKKSVILILPWGGPCQLDTLDPKPDAPAEIRGEFRPIATRLTGLRICEHLPRLADRADRFTVVRSASHRISTHNSATHYVLTGHPPAITNRELVPASPADWPSLGSLLAKLQPGAKTLPSYVMEPCELIDQAIFSAGQNAGFLGAAYQPFVIRKDPDKPDFSVDGLDPAHGLTAERLADRRGLLEGLPSGAAPDLQPHYERAYDLLTSTATREAFDLRREPAKLRERYGPTRFGQSVLLARRLTEAGVRLVLVSDTIVTGNDRWDTHNGDAYVAIKKQLAETDLALSALFDDLRDRGLWDSTLVLWMAEFGRTPKMVKGGGRDHWPHCYSLLLAGGGFKEGMVYGSSDAQAAYPREHPVCPEDLHATLYRLLDIPPDTVLTDPLGRPQRLCDGRPIEAII